MPVISGSFETGTDGWKESWSEYKIGDYDAYRNSSGSGTPARTGNYYLVSDSYLTKEIPVEAKNSQMEFECYARAPSYFEENQTSGYVALVGLPHNEDIDATLIKKTNFSFNASQAVTYQKIGITSPIDASFDRYFIFISALYEFYGGMIDDWKISWEPNTSTYCKHNNVWKPSEKYVKHNGVWKPAETKVKHSNVWKGV